MIGACCHGGLVVACAGLFAGKPAPTHPAGAGLPAKRPA
ncbi:hypothetical protein PRJ_4576 [Pseudomonas sp. XWY-1]|nr:hypothetical protein PRJ_4576 [Pseudomonas sp. XWY-1]